LGRQAKLDDYELAIAITDQTINPNFFVAWLFLMPLTARDFARIDIRIDKWGSRNF